jgi:hypothetical protein
VLNKAEKSRGYPPVTTMSQELERTKGDRNRKFRCRAYKIDHLEDGRHLIADSICTKPRAGNSQLPHSL